MQLRIVKRLREIKKFDLIIIGAGPAGMAATLYACRQNLNFMTISKELGGLPMKVPSVENYLGYRYVTGFDLVDKFNAHVGSYKNSCNIDPGEGVRSIKKAKGGFAIKTDKSEYFSKAILIASGRDVKKLGIKGEETFYGKGLSYCPSCDGPFFNGKTVAVIGGGRTGLDATFQLLNIAKKIYIVELTGSIKADPHMLSLIKKSGKVEVLTGADTREIFGADRIRGITVKQKGKTKKIEVDGVFVTIGYEPKTDFARGLLKTNDRGEIVVDKENKTSVRGIFAAGDCTDVHEKQIIVAAGEGAKALLSASTYVTQKK
jgi:thioredoxin reductase